METKIKVAQVFGGRRHNTKYTIVDREELEELIDSRAEVEALITIFKKILGYTALVTTGIVLGVILL
ncbi:hypothetical protein [Lachnoanaerobaculum saburreum]|jgi:hypothetical protein|uniref:Uncharacterized protein n=1 Tax=Lachnoanaerobaculum saburreum TaxID=467210 RepID=A0A133ZRQ0_9FIRM|nr:hypothetical protein [Lachnoanaerobaculum saburreum]KXB58147.1 hypothetical protein HMPREF1866_01186 [Lachnoanaerobaculum saburreum]